MITKEQIAAIAPFEGDLLHMTEQQIRDELEIVSDRIDQDTAWQEALTACLAIKGDGE